MHTRHEQRGSIQYKHSVSRQLRPAHRLQLYEDGAAPAHAVQPDRGGEGVGAAAEDPYDSSRGDSLVAVSRCRTAGAPRWAANCAPRRSASAPSAPPRSPPHAWMCRSALREALVAGGTLSVLITLTMTSGPAGCPGSEAEYARYASAS
ncbi:hypothetical protein JYU34_002288 [Plutella xylostella]|uniref:Uncharacterized protein n=1 Tax=Plutella xylostella TaxID=51655 RepID=A0ABQ7R1S1_PLUXY|nr:hypothetical protein JYU34_002288 [Plutella xylostella]